MRFLTCVYGRCAYLVGLPYEGLPAKVGAYGLTFWTFDARVALCKAAKEGSLRVVVTPTRSSFWGVDLAYRCCDLCKKSEGCRKTALAIRQRSRLGSGSLPSSEGADSLQAPLI